MSVELLEKVKSENGVRKGKILRNNLNLKILPPSVVTENSATLRGKIVKFFPPAFFDDGFDLYFSYNKLNSSNSTNVFVGEFTEEKDDHIFSAEISGLTRNTAYEVFVYGEVDGTTVVSGPPLVFRTGVFSISTVRSENIGQEEATLVGELSKFQSLVFERSGPFNIESKENSGLVTFANTQESESPLFVLEDFSDDNVLSNINTRNEILNLEGSANTSIDLSPEVTFDFNLNEEVFEFSKNSFLVKSEIERDINAGFEYKKTSDSTYKSVKTVSPPNDQGDEFSSVVQLDANSDYEFRAWGTIGSFERIYGNVQTFSTIEKEIVEFETQEASSIGVTDATLNASVNNIEPSGRQIQIGFNYGKESGSVTDNQTSLDSIVSPRDFSDSLTGIDSGVTYEYQPVAIGENGTYTGPIKTFTTKALTVETLPQSASTDPAKDPTEGTANLFGEITALNPDSPFGNAEFKFGTEEPLTSTADAGSSSPSDGQFTVDISGLQPGTEYKYKVRGVDPETNIEEFGDVETVNTAELGVFTFDAQSIGRSSVTFKGEVTELGTGGSFTVYFEWRKEGNTTFNKTADQSFTSETEFTENLTGLNEAEVYEFRAVIEKNTARTTGETKEFQTKSVEISTLSASNRKAGTIDLNGELTFFSSEISEASVFFEYRRPGFAEKFKEFAASSPVSSATTFSKTVTGLNPGTTYEYKAYANPRTAKEQEAATLEQFTTKDLQVTTTEPPISRTEESLTFEGELTVYGGDFSTNDVIVGHQYVRLGSGGMETAGKKIESPSSPVSSLTTFQTQVSGLISDRIYLYRSFATVGGTTTFGAIHSGSTNLN